MRVGWDIQEFEIPMIIHTMQTMHRVAEARRQAHETPQNYVIGIGVCVCGIVVWVPKVTIPLSFVNWEKRWYKKRRNDTLASPLEDRLFHDSKGNPSCKRVVLLTSMGGTVPQCKCLSWCKRNFTDHGHSDGETDAAVGCGRVCLTLFIMFNHVMTVFIFVDSNTLLKSSGCAELQATTENCYLYLPVTFESQTVHDVLVCHHL